MTLVVDASIVVAALIDSGRDGTWAAETLQDADNLVAPHLLPVEAANVLRRAARAGHVSADSAALAHADLVKLPIGLFGYAPFADRVWELRDTLTAYHAWYVALAEALGAALATLDRRLTRSPSARCSFVVPAD